MPETVCPRTPIQPTRRTLRALLGMPGLPKQKRPCSLTRWPASNPGAGVDRNQKASAAAFPGMENFVNCRISKSGFRFCLQTELDEPAHHHPSCGSQCDAAIANAISVPAVNVVSAAVLGGSD